MGLLLKQDYDLLNERNIKHEEDDSSRLLIFPEYALPPGMYNVDVCSVIVVIPTNYNDGGIDMFWTYPFLSRADQKAIPAISAPGAGENRRYKDQEHGRWSRHWNQGHNQWKSGKDNVKTILHRLEWAFKNPDAGK